jgi:hypothetical protein
MDQLILQRVASELGSAQVNKIILEAQLQEAQLENTRLQAEIERLKALLEGVK